MSKSSAAITMFLHHSSLASCALSGGGWEGYWRCLGESKSKKWLLEIEVTSFRGDYSIPGYPLLQRRSKPKIELGFTIHHLTFLRKVGEVWSLPVEKGQGQGKWSYPSTPKIKIWQKKQKSMRCPSGCSCNVHVIIFCTGKSLLLAVVSQSKLFHNLVFWKPHRQRP